MVLKEDVLNIIKKSEGFTTEETLYKELSDKFFSNEGHMPAILATKEDAIRYIHDALNELLKENKIKTGYKIKQ